MHKTLTVANFLLVLSMLGLTALGIQTWVYPAYPMRVDGARVTATPKEISIKHT